MVHLYIAKKLADMGLPMKHSAQFYLGSISPDAIHMRPNSDRPMKNNTHLIPEGQKFGTVDEKEFTDHITGFINANKNSVNNDFLLGYGTHTLTDMYWSKLVYNPFKEKYRMDKSPVQEERPAYYNDTDVIDLMLFDECSWKDEVWQLLQNAACSDFLDILSAAEIKSWNERTLSWYGINKDKQHYPVKYITKPEADNFIRDFILNNSSILFRIFTS